MEAPCRAPTRGPGHSSRARRAHAPALARCPLRAASEARAHVVRMLPVKPSPGLRARQPRPDPSGVSCNPVAMSKAPERRRRSTDTGVPARSFARRMAGSIVGGRSGFVLGTLATVALLCTLFAGWWFTPYGLFPLRYGVSFSYGTLRLHWAQKGDGPSSWREQLEFAPGLGEEFWKFRYLTRAPRKTGLIQIPPWTLVLIWVVSSSVVSWRRLASPVPDRCNHCGYLSGTSSICPECGQCSPTPRARSS